MPDTPATLRAQIEAVDQRLSALDRRVSELREGDREAVRVALESLKERLALLNELRSIVADQSQEFARAKEVDGKFEAVRKDVTAIEKLVDEMRITSEGRHIGSKESRLFIIGVVTLVTGLIIAAVALFNVATGN
jgi:hypothetical protein